MAAKPPMAARPTMAFAPDELPPATPPLFEDAAGDAAWAPLFRHACAFGPDVFADKMMNMVRNPNLNSNWLFRADILADDGAADAAAAAAAAAAADTAAAAASARPRDVAGMLRQRTLVRRLVPRNTRRDAPLDQTCSFHRSPAAASPACSLVMYVPHAASADDLPFYHPRVRAIAHLHQWDPVRATGSLSVHVLPFEPHHLEDQRLRRTAYHLLEVLHKHGHGALAGYVKRVRHDAIVPQVAFQERYARLKAKYARHLVDDWAETTDPGKHVFEDLAIAAFLMELWAEMYRDAPFPAFVDIGCGNGLLVYILTQEGYPGWGFDARARKSWPQYRTETACAPSGSSSLQQRLLVPSLLLDAAASTGGADDIKPSPQDTHDGIFPPGTFIISNHADELTPWTPILGAVSQCPFVMIPCCSHNLAGARYRAPPPRDKSKPKTAYASLVDWVTRIAEDCGWEVETEMLRIPSTRNTCLVGRKRAWPATDLDVQAVLRKYGGAQGYAANVAKLGRVGPRGH